MAEMVKLATRMPNGIVLRVAERFIGPAGEEMVRELGAYPIPGSRQHLGFMPGNLHAHGDSVPYVEVPVEHWRMWCEANEGHDLLTSGAVFEHDGREPGEPVPLAGPVAEAQLVEEHDGLPPQDSPVDHGDAPSDPAARLPEGEVKTVDGKPAHEMSEAELEHATRPEGEKHD